VPTNARIWIGAGIGEDGSGAPLAIRLTERPHGREVPVTSGVLTSNFHRIHVLVPEALAPDTSYDVLGPEESLGAFTTADGPDQTPPAVPRLLETRIDVQSIGVCCDCSPWRLAGFRTEHGGFIGVMDRAETSFVAFELRAGTVTDIAFTDLNGHGDPRGHLLGKNMCFTNWPEGGDGARTTVRFGAFDLAGNFSGISEPLDVQMPPFGCGCGQAGGGAGVVVLLAAFVARKRYARARGGGPCSS
jgi:hypothetical protein